MQASFYFKNPRLMYAKHFSLQTPYRTPPLYPNGDLCSQTPRPNSAHKDAACDCRNTSLTSRKSVLFSICDSKTWFKPLLTKRADCKICSERNSLNVELSTGTVMFPVVCKLGANYKKILRLSYDVIITYDNRKSNLR